MYLPSLFNNSFLVINYVACYWLLVACYTFSLRVPLRITLCSFVVEYYFSHKCAQRFALRITKVLLIKF